MNSKISEKDKKTWDEFLSNNQKLPDKDNIQNKTNIKKTRSLDLHGKLSMKLIMLLRTL